MDLADPDWAEALRRAALAPDDIARVVVLCDGRPHLAPWLGVFALRDGRFAAVRATCCGAGWECHADAEAIFAATVAELDLRPAERARAEV